MKLSDLNLMQRKRLIELLVQRDGGLMCHYCGTQLAMRISDKRISNARGCITHKLLPRDGGQDNIENLVLTCQSCKIRRRNRTYEALLAAMYNKKNRIPVVAVTSKRVRQTSTVHSSPQQPLTAKERRNFVLELAARDGGLVCRYCGVQLAVDATTKSSSTRLAKLCRVVPLSQGGTNTLDNLVLSCQRCIHK